MISYLRSTQNRPALKTQDKLQPGSWVRSERPNDDEQTLLDVFVAALSPHFEITTANNAREADFILQKKAFKVVVADHLMPGGNGMSFLVRAREEFPHMQRILVTGYMKPEMLLRSVNEAALFRYLLKPVSIPELVKVFTSTESGRAPTAATASRSPDTSRRRRRARSPCPRGSPRASRSCRPACWR